MTMRRLLRLLAMASSFVVLLHCVACGGGSATITPRVTSAGGATIERGIFNNPIARFIESYVAKRPVRSTAGVGQTTSASITSLQYFIQDIQLCESMTITGTGYSGAEGCITLYQSPDVAFVQSLDNYNSYTVTEALADTSENHFVDFMTAEGRARLQSPVTADAGTYNYGKINFFRPIRIKAEFMAPGATTPTWYTRDTSLGTIVDEGNDDGGRQVETVRLDGLLKTGPAQTMTYMLNNGGTWFPFVRPFVVAAGDSITLDFVFNPENFATATEQATCSVPTNKPPVFDLTNCVTLDMPYAKMSPVPRKESDSTRKEVYLIDWDTGASASKIRAEVYYSSGDADKSVQGVDTAVVMQSGATTSTNNVIQALRVTEASGELTFIGYNQSSGQVDATVLTGLRRRADGVVSITCNFTGGPCTSTGTTLSKAYTYVGTASL